MSALTVNPASAVTATLPVSLSASAESDADLIVIDGTTSWTEPLRAALARAPRGVLLIDPIAEPADDARAVAAEAGLARVFVADRYAGNPAIAALVERAPAALQAPASITGTVVGADRNRSALEAIRLLRALGLEIAELSRVDASGAVLLLGRTSAGASIALHAIESIDERAELRLRSFDGAVTLALAPATSARPAVVHIIDANGALQLPTIYETAHRAGLRALVSDGSHQDGFDGLIEDFELLADASSIR